MNYFQLLIHNKLLMAAICGWASAQILKTLIDLLITKEFTAERLFGSGGMPSSHSATVCALATSAAITTGINSSIFAVSAVMAIIVMYDARGVRRETGNQAEIINQIMDFLKNEHPDKETLVFPHEQLKELIGHTPLQVLMGALLGILIGFLYCMIF